MKPFPNDYDFNKTNDLNKQTILNSVGIVEAVHTPEKCVLH